VQALQKIAKAMLDELERLFVPVSHRDFVVEKALEPENVAHDLITESFKATSTALRPSQVLVASTRFGSSTRPPSEYRQATRKNPPVVVDSPCEATTKSSFSTMAPCRCFTTDSLSQGTRDSCSGFGGCETQR
jgi:hypothetical protein